jgi:DNA-binding NtrC family response regulator
MHPESTILVFRGGLEGTDLVARTLSDHYRVVEADSIDDALRYTAEEVALVIGHLESASSDGLQLLRRWKMRQPATPFLFLANGADVGTAVEAMKLGAADCLVKPVDPSRLRTAVSEALEANVQSASTGAATNFREKPAIDIPPGTSLEELERAAVEQALEQHQGNRTHAAKTLGISVRTLQRKLKAWGMPLHSHYGPGPNANGPGSNIMFSVPEPTGATFSSHFH